MHYINVVKVALIKEQSFKSEIKKIYQPSDVAKIACEYLKDLDREHFILICVDTQHKVNALHTVSIGSVNASIVHPREVFKVAILANATSIFVAHNHPSGNCTPSTEDQTVTKRIQNAGELLGIDLIDHIIVGDGYYSFKENGLL